MDAGADAGNVGEGLGIGAADARYVEGGVLGE